MADTLLIADLHLSDDSPELTAVFLGLLTGPAREASALYILGDLFDAWVGDDDDSPIAQKVRNGLKELTNSGVPVYIQQGNRDFLLGRRFCRETGVALLQDTAIRTINGQRTLLMHGDLLCTDDVDYQRLRKRFRSPWFRILARLKSLKERRRMAADYRRRSRAHMAQKSDSIMDVNLDTVHEYMQRFDVRCLIHGHTHRPARHDIQLDGEPAVRFVLPDWRDGQGYLMRADGKDYLIETLGPHSPGMDMRE